MAKRGGNHSPGRPAKRNSQMRSPPKNPLPVTLLSGFLGSGKTTLLQHILQGDHGLRIAVVVNDIGAINVDAALIKKNHSLSQTQEKVIALQNGCICCTLRGDLLEELVRLAELQSFDYIIVESSGISEPEQVAETFDARLAQQIADLGSAPEGLDAATQKTLKRIIDAGGLEKFARLDTTVTVIDAFTILDDFHTDQLISARRDDVVPEDERTVSDLMVDQIEFADVIVLNKVDMVDEKMRARVRDFISKLNRRAKVVEVKYGKVDAKEILNTKLFNLERAQTGYGWLQDLHAMTLREVNGRKKVTPKPETEEYNVRNFVYSRQRPFHPKRLWELLYDKFVLQMQHDDEDEDGDEDEGEDGKDDEGQNEAGSGSEEDESSDDSEADADKREVNSSGSSSEGGREDEAEDPLEPPPNEQILANKKAHPLLGRLFRSKGEFLLATRPHRAGEWSQAGAMLTLLGGRPWFCTLPAEEYTVGDDEIDSLVQHDIEKGGEWGDRRQELVFIGENLDVEGLQALLDRCLLTDAEFESWAAVMRRSAGANAEKTSRRLERLFDDGFPDWPEDDSGDHAGHNH